VNPDVALGMKLRRLFDPFHARDFRQNFGEELGVVEELEAAASGAFGEDFGQLVADALGGNLENIRDKFRDREESAALDCIAETRSKSHGANHAQLVFAEAIFGISDGANDSGAQVFLAADEIENFIRERVEHQAVDGEVAALYIFFRPGGVFNPIRMAAIGVANVAAERGDFDLGGAIGDDDDAELRAHCEAIGEKLLHAIGCGVGGDVVIDRLAAKQNIPDAAASKIGLMAAIAQDAADVVGELAAFDTAHIEIMRENGGRGKFGGFVERESANDLERFRLGGDAEDEAGDVVMLANVADECVDIKHHATKDIGG
jgi:hypothetical protein